MSGFDNEFDDEDFGLGGAGDEDDQDAGIPIQFGMSHEEDGGQQYEAPEAQQPHSTPQQATAPTAEDSYLEDVPIEAPTVKSEPQQEGVRNSEPPGPRPPVAPARPPPGPPPPQVPLKEEPSEPPRRVGSDDKESSSAVYVANLRWWTTDAEVEATCSQYGKVVSLRFIEERFNGKSKGVCLVEFDNPDSAAKCKELLHGKEVDGRPVVVTFPSQGYKLTSTKATGAGSGGRGGFGPGRPPGRGDNWGGRGRAGPRGPQDGPPFHPMEGPGMGPPMGPGMGPGMMGMGPMGGPMGPMGPGMPGMMGGPPPMGPPMGPHGFPPMPGLMAPGMPGMMMGDMEGGGDFRRDKREREGDEYEEYKRHRHGG